MVFGRFGREISKLSVKGGPGLAAGPNEPLVTTHTDRRTSLINSILEGLLHKRPFGQICNGPLAHGQHTKLELRL